jgi:hypothetical protein
MQLVDIIPSTLLSESRLNTVKETVKKYLESGQILNTEFAKLKHDIDLRIDQAAEVGFGDARGEHGTLEKVGLRDLYWDVPTTLTGVGSLKNKLKNYSGINHPALTFLQKFYDDNVELVNQMKELKSMVVTVSKKREEQKTIKDEGIKKQFRDSSSLVEVLMKNIEDFVAHAEKVGLEQYERIAKTFESHDMNLDEMAPKPNINMSRGKYQATENYRSFVKSLFDVDVEPYMKKSITKKNKYIDMIEEQARADYMAWIHKMIEKIGKPVVSATATGNPWQNSRLLVNTNDGEEQIWHTQMIINSSKFGKLFNQFPSTRKK